MKFLLAKKVGMTQIFDEEGSAIAVTVLEAGPCIVTQRKTEQEDGYDAYQVGFGQAKKIGKSLAGHLKQSKAKSKHLAEIIIDKVDESSSEFVPDEEANSDKHLSVGDKIDCSIFETGDIVKVSAVSKGKGFAGTIKRYNFSCGPKTHGSHNYRAPGSIGAGYPQHVFKGQKMAGQMGHKSVTTKNLQIVKIDKENNLICIKGAVPGPKQALVKVRG
jgi:large subunit ribosomal protein L3